jgi:uncharacterized repeat protein (TIGR03803 family)
MTQLGILRAKGLLFAGLFAGALASWAAVADAATVTVLYAFQNNGRDGFTPVAELIDVNGTLYGTTSAGGTGRCQNGCGTLFSVNAATGAETILHSFSDVEQTAMSPGSLVAAQGKLFGTTTDGGRRNAGMVFSFDLTSSKFEPQYNFCSLDNCTDGEYASPGLLNEKGVLYGTTEDGGSEQLCQDGCGTVFAFNPATQTETILHAFGAGTSDGTVPTAGLLKVNRLLYGTTNEGGAAGDGTVFALNPKTGAESVIYAFCSQQGCPDGARPSGNLLHVNHVLYGTTEDGGANGYGTVFSIDPATHAETVLHSFTFGGSDGAYPSGLVYANGLLYGTTLLGGVNCVNGCGTVYSIDPQTGTETVIYSFCNQTDCADGADPQSSLLNVNGTLYGVAAYGGSGSCTTKYYQVAGCGTVFAITP